jgi:drug/metabolite transporter (DMT)-like permease
VPSSSSRNPFAWFFNQPYLLMCMPSLFWAGNAVVGRHAVGSITPITLAGVRWTLAFLIVLPFAWPHLRKDWPAIRSRFGLMLLLALTGIGAFNTLQYWSLEYTTALNVLLLQSVLPLFVAIWSLLLLGTRLTAGQGLGIAVSMVGVAVILLHGNIAEITSIQLNIGDVLFVIALLIFGLYSVLTLKKPLMHPMSFLAVTFGAGALMLLPLMAWDVTVRPLMQITTSNLLTLAYVAIFPSILAYLCFNRGVQLIGANRAAPFFHLIPVFGSAMAILFLGERPQLYHGIGYALVLTGIACAARRPKEIAA